MKKIFYILAFLLPLVLLSCSKNEEEDYGVDWTESALSSIRNGIDASYNSSEYDLRYKAEVSTGFSLKSDVDWLKVYMIPDYANPEYYKVVISVDANREFSSRKGIVTVVANERTTRIEVRQPVAPIAVPSSKIYSQPASGGDLLIDVRATGELVAKVARITGNWLKITSVTAGENTGEYQIVLSVDENTGLGRIASLELRVDGECLDVGPCIVQKPALFGDSVVVYAPQGGMLPILLGSDIENLRRIRKLTVAGRVIENTYTGDAIVIGGLNKLDVPILRKLFLSSEGADKQYPVDVDISECVFRETESSNPYEHYGWTPNFVKAEVEVSSSYPSLGYIIPEGVFSDATNLRSIKLRDATNIGEKAFQNCTALKYIKISPDTEYIGRMAFKGCTSLEDIEIPKNSSLIYLGARAFNTGTRLKNVFLPASLRETSTETFLFKAESVHVEWDTPLEIRTTYIGFKDATLYVPKGTAELYKNAMGWKNIKNIVEETATWQEEE